MKKGKHLIEPDGTHSPNCFPCKLATVSMAPSAMGTRFPTAERAKVKDPELQKDREAYKRLRRDGEQPKHIGGSAYFEAKANESYEITTGRIENGLLHPQADGQGVRRDARSVLQPDREGPVRLSTVANMGGHTGYGRMGREIVHALNRAGVETHHCTSPDDDDLPVHKNSLWMGAPSHIKGWWKGQITHCLTMWEATGVPPGFRENVQDLDTIIVPSQQNYELFTQWHHNVKKVPLGINPQHWNYRKRPRVRDEFRFFTAGQAHRKGIDIAIKAFNTVFGGYTPTASDPRPRLIIKDRGVRASPASSDGTRTCRPARGSPRSRATISAWDEIELYANAHVFLGLARGEGWGLMPFQAMAQGCPTILSRCPRPP